MSWFAIIFYPAVAIAAVVVVFYTIGTIRADLRRSRSQQAVPERRE
jgi:hypothetical protein